MNRTLFGGTAVVVALAITQADGPFNILIGGHDHTLGDRTTTIYNMRSPSTNLAKASTEAKPQETEQIAAQSPSPSTPAPQTATQTTATASGDDEERNKQDRDTEVIVVQTIPQPVEVPICMATDCGALQKLIRDATKPPEDITGLPQQPEPGQPQTPNFAKPSIRATNGVYDLVVNDAATRSFEAKTSLPYYRSKKDFKTFSDFTNQGAVPSLEGTVVKAKADEHDWLSLNSTSSTPSIWAKFATDPTLSAKAPDNVVLQLATSATELDTIDPYVKAYVESFASTAGTHEGYTIHPVTGYFSIVNQSFSHIDSRN